MTTHLQDSFLENLAEMLFGFHDLEDMDQLRGLVEAAHKGTAAGANYFVENTGKSLQPADLKDHLRCFPLAQAMVAMIRHYELNKDIDTLKVVLEALLDGLEEADEREILH
ncbi:hypothetical protein EOPP23_09050 [Endozoicomonas sp. OPT23]|uniref:hypothetical protein n=1 Tax=Endozoicomonas sp. OPT23 TaxID=2072845 RepID=UPI00129BDEA9|nr:hypothetical protein [Endozoicomonas sp. OPT23]MRI33129.1 hypothetical protein [Endozoicomonas sp. OPT23]